MLYNKGVFVDLYIHLIPELSSFTALILTNLLLFCSPANDYLIDSAPRPLSSAPFSSFTPIRLWPAPAALHCLPLYSLICYNAGEAPVLAPV